MRRQGIILASVAITIGVVALYCTGPEFKSFVRRMEDAHEQAKIKQYNDNIYLKGFYMTPDDKLDFNVRVSCNHNHDDQFTTQELVVLDNQCRDALNKRHSLNKVN